MREKRTVQHSIFHFYADHEIGKELQAISDWLDNHSEILDWVEADLQPSQVTDCGRKGLPVESVLRCAILKQYWQVSYEELAFISGGQRSACVQSATHVARIRRPYCIRTCFRLRG